MEIQRQETDLEGSVMENSISPPTCGLTEVQHSHPAWTRSVHETFNQSWARSQAKGSEVQQSLSAGKPRSSRSPEVMRRAQPAYQRNRIVNPARFLPSTPRATGLVGLGFSTSRAESRDHRNYQTRRPLVLISKGLKCIIEPLRNLSSISQAT